MNKRKVDSLVPTTNVATTAAAATKKTTATTTNKKKRKAKATIASTSIDNFDDGYSEFVAPLEASAFPDQQTDAANERRKLRSRVHASVRLDPALLASGFDDNDDGETVTATEESCCSSSSTSTMSRSELQRQAALSNETVRAMCNTSLADVERCELTGDDDDRRLTREQRAQLYTGRSLESIRTDVVQEARETDPSMSEASARALKFNCDQQLDLRLHRAKHRYLMERKLRERTDSSANDAGGAHETQHSIDDCGCSGEELAGRFQRWLHVTPGSALKHVAEQVDREMPDALPAVRREMAERRARELEEKKKITFECGVSDGRMCALLLDAYLLKNDTVAGELYRAVRCYQIESECRGPSMAVECRRRKLEMEQLLAMRVDEHRRRVAARRDVNSRPPDVHTHSTLEVASVERDSFGVPVVARSADGSALRGRVGAILPAADYVRQFAQQSDLTQSTDELLKTHCEAMLMQLLEVVDLTAKLVQVAPSDTVFSTETAPTSASNPNAKKKNLGDSAATEHPIDKMHALLRATDTHVRVNESAILKYLEMWTRAPELTQADIDRQLFAHHRDDEVDALTTRLRELNVSSEGIRLALTCGVEPHASPLMRTVIAVLQNDKFKEAAAAAANQTRLKARIDEQQKRADKLLQHQQQSGGARGNAVTEAEENEEVAAAAAESQTLLPIYAASARALPTYSRALLQTFMREPLPAPSLERPCFNGERCVCMSLNTSYPLTPIQGFVCREFRPHVTRESLELEPSLMCIICNRAATTASVMSYARASTSHVNAQPLELLQDHAVLIGENEYNADVLLPVTLENNKFNGIVKPQVMFSASHYSPSSTQIGKHTLRCLIELKALDFRRRWDAAIAI